MSDKETPYTPAPPGDFVLPFDLPQAGVRGRLIRLDKASAQALSAHRLPEPAARIAGEAMALATILGSALKLDGRLTVQTKSDGPLDLVTVDYYGAEETRPAALRAFARLDRERFDRLETQTFLSLAGAGALAPQRHDLPRDGGAARGAECGHAGGGDALAGPAVVVRGVTALGCPRLGCASTSGYVPRCGPRTLRSSPAYRERGRLGCNPSWVRNERRQAPPRAAQRSVRSCQISGNSTTSSILRR